MLSPRFSTAAAMNLRGSRRAAELNMSNLSWQHPPHQTPHDPTPTSTDPGTGRGGERVPPTTSHESLPAKLLLCPTVAGGRGRGGGGGMSCAVLYCGTPVRAYVLWTLHAFPFVARGLTSH